MKEIPKPKDLLPQPPSIKWLRPTHFIGCEMEIENLYGYIKWQGRRIIQLEEVVTKMEKDFYGKRKSIH